MRSGVTCLPSPPPSDDFMEAPQSSKPVSLGSLIGDLETGDIVLMSGMSLSGSIIRLFDQSEFSHVALVRESRACTCTHTQTDTHRYTHTRTHTHTHTHTHIHTHRHTHTTHTHTHTHTHIHTYTHTGTQCCSILDDNLAFFPFGVQHLHTSHKRATDFSSSLLYSPPVSQVFKADYINQVMVFEASTNKAGTHTHTHMHAHACTHTRTHTHNTHTHTHKAYLILFGTVSLHSPSLLMKPLSFHTCQTSPRYP